MEKLLKKLSHELNMPVTIKNGQLVIGEDVLNSSLEQQALLLLKIVVIAKLETQLS